MLLHFFLVPMLCMRRTMSLNVKLGISGTGAGLEPAPTDLSNSVIYQQITPKFVICMDSPDLDLPVGANSFAQRRVCKHMRK